MPKRMITKASSVPALTRSRRMKSRSPLLRDARTSRSNPGGGQPTPGAFSGTGRATSVLLSSSARSSSTSLRNAGSPLVTGAHTSDRISPCDAGISFQRHDRPLRSGRVPGAAGEHRVRNVLRGCESGDTDVEPLFSHGGNGNERNAKLELEIVARPGRGGGERGARHCSIRIGDREARAISTEHEGKLAASERVRYCG